MSSPDTTFSPEEVQSPLGQALALMRTALVLLDEADAPADIGAHLDLAICRLGEMLDRASPTVREEPPSAD